MYQDCVTQRTFLLHGSLGGSGTYPLCSEQPRATSSKACEWDTDKNSVAAATCSFLASFEQAGRSHLERTCTFDGPADRVQLRSPCAGPTDKMAQTDTHAVHMRARAPFEAISAICEAALALRRIQF